MIWTTVSSWSCFCCLYRDIQTYRRHTAFSILGCKGYNLDLYAGEEATVRTGHGNKWIQNWKRSISRLYVLLPCLFNLDAEYIIRNSRLVEAQAGIKIAGRNIDYLRYADDTTLMAESEEELKSLLMKVKEESETAGLQINIQKTKIMASGPITSSQIDGETMETVKDYFLGLQNHCRWWQQPWN